MTSYFSFYNITVYVVPEKKSYLTSYVLVSYMFGIAVCDMYKRIIITIMLCRACNLTSFLLCLTGPVDYPIASCHKWPGFKSPGGYLWETRILKLALFLYIGDPDVIDHCGLF